MSERRLNLMDIREMIRHIREERSDRQVGKDVGVDRCTVKRYREWAQEQGLLEVCRMGEAQRNPSFPHRGSPRPSSRRAAARFGCASVRGLGLGCASGRSFWRRLVFGRAREYTINGRVRGGFLCMLNGAISIYFYIFTVLSYPLP